MAFEVITANQVAAYSIDDFDTVTLMPGVTLTNAVEGFTANTGADTELSSARLNILGTVVSGAMAVDFFTGVDIITNVSVNIGATGEIHADNDAVAFDTGNNNSIINNGLVTFGDFGLYIQGGNDNSIENYGALLAVGSGGSTPRSAIYLGNTSGNTSFVNTGLISGTTSNGLLASGSVDTTIFNSGEIISTSGSAFVSGGAGVDVFTNTGLVRGNIYLGQDADTFDGRGGVVNGTVYGGTGNDTYFVSDSTVGLLEGIGQGNDTVNAEGSFKLGSNFENLNLLGDGNTRGIGNSEANSIVGNFGDNRLRGKGGNDSIFGGEGDDNIRGQKGNDLLYGDYGDDIIKGNRGNDTLRGGAGDDQLKGGVGNDRYVFDFNNDGNDTIKDVGGSSDTLAVTGRVMSQLDFRRSGNDLVIESGGTVDRVVIDDFYIAGDAGRVELLETTTTTKYLQTGLIGGATADIIVGFSGTQIINGGGGDDILIGKGGKDRISGGSGADRFDYDALSDSGTTATTMDTIYDFVAGTDRIDLFDIDADSTTAGNQNFSFIGAGAYTGTAGELRYDFVGGNTRLGVDVDGDMVDDFNILLAGNIAFSAGDFVL